MNNDLDLFNFYPAQGQMCGLLSIPHSGELLPSEFHTYLSKDSIALMQDIDYRVHELIDIPKLTKAGISILKSNIIRTAIDLNRSPETCLLNWKQNSKGVQVVIKEPTFTQGELLVAKYYTPYFEMLKSALYSLKSQVQVASFIDLHSMPAKAEQYHLKINPHQKIDRPDFCVSDICAKSCEPEFISHMTNILSVDYSNTTNNDPYFGGFITQFINTHFSSDNNIQIEISRGIYMDEVTKRLIPEEVNRLRPILTQALIKQFHFFYNKYKI